MKTKNDIKDKTFQSLEYNFYFDSKSGFFMRFGKTKEDNPEYSKFGPEIIDMEISTQCSRGCSFCYKSNTSIGKNMSLYQFKQIFNTFPRHLTQIAFGIGDIDANPDLWEIMQYCIDNDVVPNITINGSRMTDELYKQLVYHCGAVAVSLYDKDTCYNAVKKLSDNGLKQVNIHSLLSEETFEKCMKVMKDYSEDKRLEKLNAIVFLWLKPKGYRNHNTQVSLDKYKQLVSYAIENNIPIGFDSCSASNFSKVLKELYPEQYKNLEENIEPCESTLFSYYINIDGFGYPCSFSENIAPYNGIDLNKVTNFVKEVWLNKETLKFREDVMENKDCNGCRRCPIYDLEV